MYLTEINDSFSELKLLKVCLSETITIFTPIYNKIKLINSQIDLKCLS